MKKIYNTEEEFLKDYDSSKFDKLSMTVDILIFSVSNEDVDNYRKTTKKKVEIVEYYDLPYRYNQTVVKVLAQTPNTLFVYWDISDDDRNLSSHPYII